MAYERDAVRTTVGYEPGKQVADASIVKLNTNENPYPPCEAVVRALRDFPADLLRRYPPPRADEFRAVAAAVHGVKADQIVAVNGSDELVRLAVTTFVDPGAPIGVLEPSYSLYPVVASLQGSPVVRVPLADDWSIPGAAEREFASAGVKLVFVVNPHAPSGALVDVSRLRALARGIGAVLAIDEAYVDFVDPARAHDALRLTQEADNVLVLRTLSKGYGLAGLRFGYGIGHAELIRPIVTKTRDTYNVDAIAQRLAAIALEHRASAASTWERVRKERARVSRELGEMGLSLTPSEANFVLPAFPRHGPTAAEVCRILESRHVLVRHFLAPRLDDKLRITIGTPEQNARLLHELRNIVQGPLSRDGRR